MVEDGGRAFEFDVPEELVPGVYANALGVWFTGHEFTFDFAVREPLEAGRVVSRIRLPPTAILQVLRIISIEMTRYEETYGEIRRIGE
jgi:hypothetical protein